MTAIYFKGRRRLAGAAAREAPWALGEVEVNESYFRPWRARGKAPVLGLRKQHGRVYAEVVRECSRTTRQTVIRRRVPLVSVNHSDGLVDVGYAKHIRARHHANEFARGEPATWRTSRRTSTGARGSGPSPSAGWLTFTGPVRLPPASVGVRVALQHHARPVLPRTPRPTSRPSPLSPVDYTGPSAIQSTRTASTASGVER